MPSRTRLRTSEGASHEAPLPITRKYGAVCDCRSHSALGAKAAVAITITVITNKPRTIPNAAPRTRSTHRRPASRTAQLTILPIAPARMDTAVNTTKKATILAAQGGLIKVIHPATVVYSQAASRNPTTTPAREKTSKKKPCAAATKTDRTMIAAKNQSPVLMNRSRTSSPDNDAGLYSSSRPVNRRKASTYFSLVFATTSGGSAGAGGFLSHLICSR